MKSILTDVLYCASKRRSKHLERKLDSPHRNLNTSILPLKKTEVYPCQFITTEGVLREICSPTAFGATLPNGKPIIAFIKKKRRDLVAELAPGDTVSLRVSPADFDAAEIIDKLPSPPSLAPSLQTSWEESLSPEIAAIMTDSTQPPDSSISALQT